MNQTQIKFLTEDIAKVDRRDKLNSLINDFLIEHQELPNMGLLKEDQITFIFKETQYNLDDFNPRNLYIYVDRELSKIEEAKIYHFGFDDIVDIEKINSKGFYRMISSNLYRSINEIKNKKIQDKIYQASRLTSLGLLAGGIAHELNNPLTAMKGYALKLRRSSEEGTLERKIADKMTMISDRMAKVVSGIRNYSRSGGLEDSEYTEPMLILNYVIGFMEGLLLKEKVNIVIEDAIGENYRAWVNRSKLEGLFQNLISNAADAMEKGGKITISSRILGEDKYQFVFEDTGEGMDDETITKIFEPFFTTKGVGKGTGLGMGIVLEAIDIHKGTIDVSSKLGIGTKFIITLAKDRRPNRHEQNTQRIEKSKRGKIALIDDDVMIGEIFKEFFQDRFDIDFYMCPKAFLESNLFQYSLVITDLMMPQIDGFELGQRIKEINSLLPVWLISSNQKVFMIQDKLNSPFDAILLKPIDDFDELAERIETLFSD